MRILTLALAGAVSLIAAPALAQTGVFYGGVDFGATHATDIKVASSAVKLDTDYGYDAGVFLGYDMPGPFRVEVEGAYKRVELNAIVPFSAASVEGAGNISVSSVMLNAFMDFGDDERATRFFVGGGIGKGRIDFDGLRPTGALTDSFGGDDDGLAWQIMAGGRTPINDRTDLKVMYRYFAVDDVDIQPATGPAQSVEFYSHSVLVGVSVNFGPGAR
jgi:OmpA-OmpF porin, OOP family